MLIDNTLTSNPVYYPSGTTSVPIGMVNQSIYDKIRVSSPYREVLWDLVAIRNKKREAYIGEQKEYQDVINQKEQIALQMKKMSFAMDALNAAEDQIRKEIAKKYDDEINPPSEDLIELKLKAGDEANGIKLKLND